MSIKAKGMSRSTAGRFVAASAMGLVLAALCTGAQAQGDGGVHRYVDAQGKEVTVRWGQGETPNYGPKPAFAQLDKNHDGFISREEAEAYPPLASDFDYVTKGERISAAQYARWNHQ